MKIKIKSSAFFAPSIFTVFYVLFFIFILGSINASGLWPSEGTLAEFLAYVKERNYFYYLLLNNLHWLLVGVAVLFGLFIMQHARQRQHKNDFRSLTFEAKGVLLEMPHNQHPILLPYEQTQLAIRIRTALIYNQKSGRHHWALARFELSFNQQGHTFSAWHVAKFPFLQQILDEGKKFQSCTVQVSPLNEKETPCHAELDFIRFLEEQIENHRRYGLMLTDFPQQRSANLVLGTCLLFLLFMMSLSFRFFISGHASLWVLGGAGLFMLLILCASIKSFVCFFAGLKRERQLQKLKRRQ